MAYVHVPFSSVEQLLETFRDSNWVQCASSPQRANFVLVDPSLYFGSYGGLLYTSLLDGNDFDADPISDRHSLVWWRGPLPKLPGDTLSLSAEGRVAVTPALFQKLKPKTFRKTRKSSYFR